MTSSPQGVGPLRQVLLDACEEAGATMQDLTVGNFDPFRRDTPANHRDGAWLGEQWAAHVGRPIHPRGLHYTLATKQVVKPNGEVYRNVDADWEWVQDAVMYARWLGYVEFDQITDERNEPPVVRLFSQSPPVPSIEFHRAFVPDPAWLDMKPWTKVEVEAFPRLQPYRLVLIGEKSSLRSVLEPLAQEYQADLYLPSGDLSDARIFEIAQNGVWDGRRTMAFYLSDCDPSGWHMPIVLARKLQAHRARRFHGFSFEVRRVALTPDQVRELQLPSTPLKATERRADRWLAQTGVAQTEIDALATLQPDTLQALVREALDPWFDHDLDPRARAAESAWQAAANKALRDAIDAPELRARMAEARAKAADITPVLRELQADGDAISTAAEVRIANVALPPIEAPEGKAAGTSTAPLIDSDWDFIEATERLIAEAGYEGANDSDTGNP